MCSQETEHVLFDLHTHSNFSDGALPPRELVAAACDCGITHLAITDHDNYFAIEQLLNEDAAAVTGQHKQLQIISGAEFSTRWESTDVHVLALNFPLDSVGIKELVQYQIQARDLRNTKILDKLSRAGVEVDKLSPTSEVTQLGRVHIAQSLVKAGYVKNPQQAFKKYLGRSGRAYVKSDWASLRDVIDTINEAGGTAVLAHPLKYKLTRVKLTRLVEDFAALGGTAIEVISGKQPIADTTVLADLSLRLNLGASLGSDFHSPGQPWSALGCAGELPRRCIPVWEQWRSIRAAV